ncbi:ABC transporter ATP-binding protein [Methylobrevis albus]|uniref:ABC transporter ATP-binding protein n=1 Tax=Methylobrevis albus TaxID=2793297 RepID=A0A931MW95_9HYPH|nr:ABC transporter ATP-binding protein [Methylobrevis albus]MBH0236408.1 ABC transporter ATP-binding protein [Methylobrevis albus]
MATVTLLETNGLSRRFGGLKAVDGVDFRLDRGEIRAVIGPNGAGKTTFVSLVAGRVPPSEGSIRFEGEDVTRLPAHARVRRGIAYTFQITSIFGNLSVFDNVALAVQSALAKEAGFGARLDEAEIRGRTMTALDLTGLAARADQPAGTLAYGHQRLVEVAMGLGLAPKLLILDEPTQGLSDPEIADFIGLVRTIAETATVMLIEHNMAVVMDLATRITVLDRGRILAEGTPAEIRADARVQHAYLGT